MSKRDKFLTNVLGMCWHEPMTVFGDGYNYYICKHCGATPLWKPDAFIQPHFSELQWFGILYEWVIRNPQFYEMFQSDFSPFKYPSVSPDIFADCVYNFLQSKEREQIQAKASIMERIKNMIGVVYEKG